jgi:3-phenylpropionate/trans-cinnamate dioxygenase ferredoxin reductase subunit
MDSSRILAVRTVDDAVRLKSAMEKKPRRAVVVGASMVGAKLVELFLRAGSDVVLADRADRIFPLSAHPDCSRMIEERLMRMGVKLRFSTEMIRAADTSEGLEIYFKGGSEPLCADILLMCVGTRPNLGFVDRDEIETRQGILVDCRMESSVPGIYAAGDAAQGMNLSSGSQQIVGILSNARRQGYAAGCNMAGANMEYAGELPHNIVHFLDMNFVGIGDPNCCDRCESLEEDGRLAQIFYKDGEICGANMLDFFSEAGTFKNALRKSKILGSVRSGHSSPAWSGWSDWQSLLARMDPRGGSVLRLQGPAALARRPS